MTCKGCGFPVMVGYGEYHLGCLPPRFIPSDIETESGFNALIDKRLVRITMLPPHNSAPTSIEAARAIKPLTGRLLKLVHGCIVKAGKRGMTDFEIQTALKMEGSTERPRRVTLAKLGLIEQHGVRKHGKRNAQVWRKK
jgi:hypothetical protein